MIYNKFLKGNMIIHANHNKYDLMSCAQLEYILLILII